MHDIGVKEGREGSGRKRKRKRERERERGEENRKGKEEGQRGREGKEGGGEGAGERSEEEREVMILTRLYSTERLQETERVETRGMDLGLPHRLVVSTYTMSTPCLLAFSDI